MSSLVSLANDIFAADLNELQTFRDQVELRAEAQAKAKERENKLHELQERQKKLLLESENNNAVDDSLVQQKGKSIKKGGAQQQQQQPSSGRRGTKTTNRRQSVDENGNTTSAEHNDADFLSPSSDSNIPPPVTTKTDLTGLVSDSRVDPFLDLVRALDNHSENVANANAPYLKWMKQRMNYLNNRSNLVAGTQPIPEDVLGDDEKDAEEVGSELAPPPLAIPLLGFTRAHAEELKEKYSYQPPRGLLTAGKVTEKEFEQMKKENENDFLETKLGSHSAGETWKEAGFKRDQSALTTNSGRKKNRGSKIHDGEQDNNTNTATDLLSTSTRTKTKRKIGLPEDAFSDVKSNARTTKSRRGSVGTNLGSTADVGTSGDESDFGGNKSFATLGERSMSDFTEMYVDETDGAQKRREARQRQQDAFEAQMRAAVEFSTKRIVFDECLPGETYKQRFRLWNRSNDLRRFKIQPGSSEALQNSKVAGYSNNYTFGSTTTTGGAPPNQQDMTQSINNNANTARNNNNNRSSSYDLDGSEAYEIPQLEVNVVSPADFSSEKAIAPGTSIVVEVTVRPHWSAYENVECSIAVSHVRDVNSHDRSKNDKSQWRCIELPVGVEICKPRLEMIGSSVMSSAAASFDRLNQSSSSSSSPSSSVVSFNLPVCFFGNTVTEEVKIINRGAKANFSLRLEPRQSPFTIQPSFLELAKDQETTLIVTYRPREDQHGSRVIDTVRVSFEGSLIPGENDRNDAASRRKGRRRVYLQNVEVSGTGTDACVFVSTIGNNDANQVAMKQHRGSDAIGSVNINDAVVGFSAWRPVTLQNDSEIDIPVRLDSEVLSEHPSDIVQLAINPRFAIVPARGTCVVDLILSTKKELMTTSKSSNNNKNNTHSLLSTPISGRFFLSVQTDCGVPEVAVQRAHERRFASLSPNLPERCLMLSSESSSKNNNKNITSNEEFFVEEFEVIAQPSQPALSFTPTTLDMSDVVALTNQTNVCDAILRNDGDGELSFFIVPSKSLKNRKHQSQQKQASGMFVIGEEEDQQQDESSSDEEDDVNIQKHLRKQESKNNTMTRNKQSLKNIGHAFDDEGGLEWWAVPSQGKIAPGVELRVSIRYSARRAGSVSADLTAFCPLLDTERSPSLHLLAHGRGPTIQSNVSSLEFGSVNYGAESEVRFNLFNPSENAVYITISDARQNPIVNPLRDELNMDDEDENNENEEAALSDFQRAVRSRLVIAPSQCTLHPRQTAIITVYLRAVNPGKNEDYVKVAVQDGTDLLIPFSGSVIVPELLISPSSINLGKSVDRDVVVPCSFTLSNPSCIEVPFEVVPVDDLDGICKIDIIGYQSSIAAGALDVPINFTVTFTQQKDTPVSVIFAITSPVLQAPVLCKISTASVCQPTVSLAVTLPGQALFNQSADGFIGSLLQNVVESALLLVGSPDQQQAEEQEEGVIENTKRLSVVAPFVDPIVLSGSIESGLPYCVMDFELTINNPTGCVFPAAARPVRFPSSATAISENIRHMELTDKFDGSNTIYDNFDETVNYPGNSTKKLMLKPVPPTQQQQQTNTAVVASSTGRSTRLPKIDSPKSKSAMNTGRTGTTKSGNNFKIPALASQTEGKTFFCRAEDGTDARDRVRDELLAAASALVQTGREVAIDISSLDDKSVDTVLHGFDVHPLNVRCLATIPGVFQDNIRLDFGTGVPSTELPVTFRVSGRPVVIDPATSAMVFDKSTGINTLQLPSVVAGMRSVKRTIQITSRCPRDLKLDCRISVTGSSVGSALLPSDIFGGEAAISTSLFSKEGGGPANAMLNSWATVTPQTVTLNALQSTQITIEYKPPKDAKKVPTWDGILHIQSTIVPTNFNDKFLIAEFYERHGDDFPNQRSLNPVAVNEKVSAGGAGGTTAGSAQTVVKGVSKLPLRIPVISRPGVVENGVLLHRQAAQILATSNDEKLQQQQMNNNNNNDGSSHRAGKTSTRRSGDQMTDSSDDDAASGNNNNNNNNDTNLSTSKDSLFVDMRAREKARKDLIAKVRRERPISAVMNSTTNNTFGKTSSTHTGGFDAAAHENAVQETVLVLQYLRDRYEELRQFTRGGFILPTQLNLHVKHLHPILDVDPFPLVRFPKCFVPPVMPLHFDTSAASNKQKQFTPLPSNVASIRLQNNGITTIDARLFLSAQTARFYKIVSFTRRHGDSRPKKAANKYEPNPIETGTYNMEDIISMNNNNNNDHHNHHHAFFSDDTGRRDSQHFHQAGGSSSSWISGQFKMTPQEIVDVDVAVVNAECPALQRLLDSFRSADSTASPPPPEAHEPAPYVTLPGELELRFSNGDCQKVELSSHVYVPKVSLVQDHIEFLPTVEVSLGRGQPTLSRRITLTNSSPCPAAFELAPIMETDLGAPRDSFRSLTNTNNTNNVTHTDPEEPSSHEVQQLTSGGARQGIAKNTAKALLASTAVAKQRKNIDVRNNTSSTTKIAIKPPPRREITLKAAANSVDVLALTKNKLANGNDDDDDEDDDVAIYDTGRFTFSTARGHLPPASSAGVPSRTEIDVFFEPFASSLFEAKFRVEVEGGVGSTLNVRAQSRVTEV